MAEYSFPEKPPDWNNIDVIHRNTLPPRSHFYLYENESDALTFDTEKAKAQCLSGSNWHFHLSPSPFLGPVDFHRLDFDRLDFCPYPPGSSRRPPSYESHEFSPITVPGMWQLQGFGKGPHYTNVAYPWPVDPPNVPFDQNECGRYLTEFTPRHEFEGDQLRLRFEGVDSSFTVWVNGVKVGYSQGSRNPSEFDVTHLVAFDEPNILAVEVYQRCDGSYLEDQDQWWLSGIFRDVYLHAFPQIHIVDFHVITELDDKYKHATLKVKVELNGTSKVQLRLIDERVDEISSEESDKISDKRSGRKSNKKSEKKSDKKPNDKKRTVCYSKETVAGSSTFELPVTKPDKWTAETPTLYKLTITVLDGRGCSVSQRVGFRKVELIDGVFCVNGRPVKIRGANRHEHHPDHGRAVPYDFMLNDLMLMKQHGINAIRTCHQINDPRMYDVADVLGLWILDEADLECHGFNMTGGNPASFASDNPAWREQYIDRARQMVIRDKNHACVIIWSLGNEAFYGRNHQAMYDYIKSVDQTRPVHYEGDQRAQTVDIFSRMYASVESIVNDFAKAREWSKPLVLCEFLHAMGNGPGNCTEYIEAFYKHPRLMGGFIWEWNNHGLRTKTKRGEEYMGYGGDFGDVPNDYNFVMDGVVFSDHTPTPGLREYAKAIEPVQALALSGRNVTIVNRYDFRNLDHLQCFWRLESSKRRIVQGTAEVPKGVKPHSEATVFIDGLPDLRKIHNQEVFLNLIFKLAEPTDWAPMGYTVATGQIQITKPEPLNSIRSLTSITANPAVHATASTLEIRSASGNSIWQFSVAQGLLTSWQRGNSPNFISEPPTLGFYRAVTDNDRGGHGREWLSRHLDQASNHNRQTTWQETGAGFEVTVTGRFAPPVLAWGVETTLIYTFSGDSLHIRVKAAPEPKSIRLPSTFARIGLTLGLYNAASVSWWGRGPGESYRDSKQAQLFGRWSESIEDLWTDYEFPQDGGNRTDVRSVQFRHAYGWTMLRARFGDLEGASFSASHYSTKDIDECTHPHELRKRRRLDTLVRLDWEHHGLGTGSCGPWTRPEYKLQSQRKFDFEVLLD